MYNLSPPFLGTKIISFNEINHSPFSLTFLRPFAPLFAFSSHLLIFWHTPTKVRSIVHDRFVSQNSFFDRSVNALPLLDYTTNFSSFLMICPCNITHDSFLFYWSLQLCFPIESEHLLPSRHHSPRLFASPHVLRFFSHTLPTVRSIFSVFTYDRSTTHRPHLYHRESPSASRDNGLTNFSSFLKICLCNITHDSFLFYQSLQLCSLIESEHLLPSRHHSLRLFALPHVLRFFSHTLPTVRSIFSVFAYDRSPTHCPHLYHRESPSASRDNGLLSSLSFLVSSYTFIQQNFQYITYNIATRRTAIMTAEFDHLRRLPYHESFSALRNNDLFISYSFFLSLYIFVQPDYQYPRCNSISRRTVSATIYNRFCLLRHAFLFASRDNSPHTSTVLRTTLFTLSLQPILTSSTNASVLLQTITCPFYCCSDDNKIFFPNLFRVWIASPLAQHDNIPLNMFLPCTLPLPYWVSDKLQYILLQPMQHTSYLLSTSFNLLRTNFSHSSSLVESMFLNSFFGSHIYDKNASSMKQHNNSVPELQQHESQLIPIRYNLPLLLPLSTYTVAYPVKLHPVNKNV